MPPPIKVELVAYDEQWPRMAFEEQARLKHALGSTRITVYHIGSTAIPGISAKPILDLILVVRSLPELDLQRSILEEMGYEWWGELGLLSRRYCTKNDLQSGRRIVQLHCYAVGSLEIQRHLAFRDYLRQRPDLVQAYDAEKVRCQRHHPNDSHAYGDCKSEWIKAIDSEALVHLNPVDAFIDAHASGNAESVRQNLLKISTSSGINLNDYQPRRRNIDQRYAQPCNFIEWGIPTGAFIHISGRSSAVTMSHYRCSVCG